MKISEIINKYNNKEIDKLTVLQELYKNKHKDHTQFMREYKEQNDAEKGHTFFVEFSEIFLHDTDKECYDAYQKWKEEYIKNNP